MDLASVAKPIVQKCENGVEIHHPPIGTLFILAERTDTLRSYRAVTLKPGQKLTARSDYKRLLIRSGRPGQFNYYPVPMLYMTQEERRESASKRGRTNPSPRWIKQQQDRITSLLAG